MDDDAHEVAETCDTLVREGGLAKILTKPPTYINAKLVMVRCEHCKKLHGET